MEQKTYCCHMCPDDKKDPSLGKSYKYLGTYGYARFHYYFRHQLRLNRNGGYEPVTQEQKSN